MTRLVLFRSRLTLRQWVRSVEPERIEWNGVRRDHAATRRYRCHSIERKLTKATNPRRAAHCIRVKTGSDDHIGDPVETWPDNQGNFDRIVLAITIDEHKHIRLLVHRILKQGGDRHPFTTV